MLKLKPASDYVLITPDKPKGGSFDAGDTYINETGIVTDVGPLVSEETRKLKGKRVMFNAWACDEKKIGNEKFYFAPESANAVCGILNA